MSDLTHFDADGRPRMVDVGDKAVTSREAIAEGRVRMEAQTLERILARTAGKGDVVTVAELAGIQGAKRTADLIPLCHPLPLDGVDLTILPAPDLPGVCITAAARTTGRTGVEMEALTAVATACLTVYDMLKAIDRAMEIDGIRLVEKSGGRSGHWRRSRDADG